MMGVFVNLIVIKMGLISFLAMKNHCQYEGLVLVCVEKCPEGTLKQPSGAWTCKAGTCFDKLSNTCKTLSLCP